MSEGLVIIVCGGRDYADVCRVFDVLDQLHATRGIALVREGGASGADALACRWARDRGILHDTVYADWVNHGRAAGPIRNRAMLNRTPVPVAVVAFPGGSGTRDMIRQAKEAGVVVMEVSDVAEPRKDHPHA